MTHVMKTYALSVNLRILLATSKKKSGISSKQENHHLKAPPRHKTIPPLVRRITLSIFMIPLLHAWHTATAEWQWSIPTAEGRAFLWIPPHMEQTRGVVVAQHNMLEQPILEHPVMRETLAELGFAQIWIVPPLDPVFAFDRGAGECFEELMQRLAEESGYAELTHAPVVPIGHSACASYPWNFAAWNPGRTLAVLSIKGDAPLTAMTGSGRPNPAWGARNLNGVPSLMVMGEYEWVEDRLTPALEFRREYPQAPIAMLAEPGLGHFDASDGLVEFLALFIRKAAEQRLPQTLLPNTPPELRPIDPEQGWLVQRWHLDQPRNFDPAPFHEYEGDPADVFWAFDEETTHAIHNYRADQIGKRPQLLGFLQDKKLVPQTNTNYQVGLRFSPATADEITFDLGTTFLEEVQPGSPNLSRWTQLPAGASLGHAAGGTPITLSTITGPVKKIVAATFQVNLDRVHSTSDRRKHDIWLYAAHPGDAHYKSAVQHALLRITPNLAGADQTLTFPKIPDQTAETSALTLTATSSYGLPVFYYVREGPAIIDGNTLRITPLPARARFPIKVTIVAWQWGRQTEPKVKTALPVTQTFLIQDPDTPEH